jgi:succinate dehydrogenase / fumarate reductase flavoprotein subunit
MRHGTQCHGAETSHSEIQQLRKEFWSDLFVPGPCDDFNPELEKAWRVADFLELGELMCQDALAREESCGGHFREEHQTDKGEAKRDDKDFMYVSAWEWKGEDTKAELHKEKLEYEEVKVAQRSYE